MPFGRDAHEKGETLNQFAIESGKRHKGRKLEIRM